MRNYTDLDFIIGSVHNIVDDTDVADLDLNLYSPPDVFERYFGLLMSPDTQVPMNSERAP